MLFYETNTMRGNVWCPNTLSDFMIPMINMFSGVGPGEKTDK